MNDPEDIPKFSMPPLEDFPEPAGQPRTGNVDEAFDDFSPGVPASPAKGNVHALQLVDGGDALYVRKGTIKGVVVKIGATELDDDYTQNALSIPGTGSRTYWIKLTSSGGDLDDPSSTKSAEIVFADPGADTATQAKQILGSVTTDSGNVESFSSNLGGSQNVDSCGSDHSWNRI